MFCVVSRYHGGAFVVFSKTLNEGMEVAAVEGSYASVLGGAPAAAVVFAGEVNKRTAADPRIAGLEARITEARAAEQEAEAARLTAELAALRPEVRSEKLGQVADEFDTAHSIQRAPAGRVGGRDRRARPACGHTWWTRCGAAWRVDPSCAGTLTGLPAHDPGASRRSDPNLTRPGRSLVRPGGIRARPGRGRVRPGRRAGQPARGRVRLDRAAGGRP